MVGTKKYLSWGLASLIVMVFACGKETENKNSLTNQSEDRQTAQTRTEQKSTQHKSENEQDRRTDSATAEKEIVVKLRNNIEAEFLGETFSDLKELPKQVSRKLFIGRSEDLSIELALDADQKTTFAQLRKTLSSFQLYGFRNLRFRCGKTNVKIPVAVTSSSKKPRIYTLSINASENGEFNGMKIERDGKTSWLESGDVDQGIKYANKLLQEFADQVESESDGTTQKIEIEINASDSASAQTYLMICGELHSLARTLGEAPTLSIRLWPMGYPREQPLNIGSLDEPLPTETQLEIESDKLLPEKELRRSNVEFEFKK